jgi:hypothetical protein
MLQPENGVDVVLGPYSHPLHRGLGLTGGESSIPSCEIT